MSTINDEKYFPEEKHVAFIAAALLTALVVCFVGFLIFSILSAYKLSPPLKIVKYLELFSTLLLSFLAFGTALGVLARFCVQKTDKEIFQGLGSCVGLAKEETYAPRPRRPLRITYDKEYYIILTKKEEPAPEKRFIFF